MPSLSNGPLRILNGTQVLSENSTPLTDFNIKTNSTVFAVMETKGGTDPQVQMLQSCSDKFFIGLSILSMCKQINFLAQSRAFCFICLEKNEWGWHALW